MRKILVYSIVLFSFFTIGLKTVYSTGADVSGTQVPTNSENICAGYLGETDNPNTPAYYLSFAFKLIKYAAIVMLFAFTVLEFVKAVPSGDNDAVKKSCH